jgi:hypothetical protein
MFSAIAAAQEESSHPAACTPPAPACVPPPPAPCGDRTLHHTQVIIVPHEEVTTEPQINIRDVVTRVPTTSLAIEYREEKRCVTVMVPKPHEIERVVETITCVPETTIDPCTGQCCTTYKNVPETKVVKTQIFVPCPETREVMVRVPVLKPVPIELEVKQLTADWSTKAVPYVKLEGIVIPTEIKVPCPPISLPPLPTCPHCAH